VSNPCNQLTPEVLNTLIEQYLKERLMPGGVEYQWALTREFRGKTLPAGSTVGIIHRPDVRLRGPVILQVGVYNQEVLEGKFSVRVDITTQETLWVARETIPRGTLITRELLEAQQLETSSMVVHPCTQLDAIIGYRTKRTITGGRIITLDMVDVPYAVCRGDLVKITAYGDGVTAMVDGQAKQNGRPGDWIMVTNLLTKGKLKAQVVGEKSVVVQ
jgi:flagella basal body P-ring formation protein FlgA